MALSKRLRFKIFEKYNFTCQYCGRKPPEVVLEVDHVVSRKDGGLDEEMNLICSCFDCNRGKRETSLDIQKIKNQNFKKELEYLEERQQQLEAYYNFIKRKEELENEELSVFQRAWEDSSQGENSLTDHGLNEIRKLKEAYPTELVLEAIKLAWKNEKVANNEKFRYMCGILKNKQRISEDPETEEHVRIEMKKFFEGWNHYSNRSGFGPVTVDYNLKNEIAEIFKFGWSYTDIADYVKETFDFHHYDYSYQLTKLLKQDKRIYKHD